MSWMRFGTPVLLVLALAAGVARGADLPASMVTIERFAAERGDANAQYFMGEHRELGDSGLDKDLRKALEWYDKAAKQSHAAAQYKLGVFHEKGLAGLSSQPEAAKDWYRRAAAQGYRQAQQRLAEFDAAKLDAETRRQEQVRKAEAERQEQQRKVEAEKIRARELQAAKTAVALPVAASAPAVKKDKPLVLGAGPLMDHVQQSKWYEGARLAEFMPTADTSCLKTGDEEITCFSKERKRVVTAAELTFSLKTVLHNFAANGFDVGYTYHVSALRDAAATGAAKDDYGLLLAEGWQQPSQTAKCQLKELGRVECRGPQNKIREYVAR